MPESTSNRYVNITLTDVHLASAYYPILIDLAKHKHCLTYSELVNRAKAKYVDRPVVQKAIAVSTDRRLDVVRMFTEERELPDLSALVISKGTGECGIGFTRRFDPVTIRENVFAFDWTEVSIDFDSFVKTAEKDIVSSNRVKKPKARELMAEHYRQHKQTLPERVRDHRELIVELIVEGFLPEDAFARALANDA